MQSRVEQAAQNLEQARGLRAAGLSYRAIRSQLGLSSGQLSHIRRALKREKAGRTRLRSAQPQATDSDMLVSRSVLPAGLRKQLTQAGYRTLGDLAERLADADFTGFETLPGVGPHKARLVTQLLDHFHLLPGPSDLAAAVADIFPEFGD